jgi:hypothetical protein
LLRHQCAGAAHLGPPRPEGERRRQAQAREQPSSGQRGIRQARRRDVRRGGVRRGPRGEGEPWPSSRSRETAERVRENSLDAIAVHTAGDGTEEVETAKAVEIAVQASGAEQAAQMTSTAAVAELSAGHRATRAKVHTSCDGPSISRKIARDGSGSRSQSREPSWTKCRSEPRTRGMARQSQKRACATTP